MSWDTFDREGQLSELMGYDAIRLILIMLAIAVI